MGLGGMGKTQTALELAYRTREKRPGCSVFWVPALSLETVRKAFTDIGLQLKVPGLQEPDADVLGLVQQHLCKDDAAPWLLILDNVDDTRWWFEPLASSAQSARLIDHLPRSDRGSILITTRSRKAAVQMGVQHVIAVPEMDEKTAVQLLRRTLIVPQREYFNETESRLVEQLTCLPLAIVQAAAYINANDISLQDYLSLLNHADDTVVELLSEHFGDEGRYAEAKNPAAMTWLISFEHIRRYDRLAVEYLSFMACLEPKFIPHSFLPRATSEKGMVDALGTLTAYSFITKRSGGKFYDMHRLVHLATRNWLKSERQLEQWNTVVA